MAKTQHSLEGRLEAPPGRLRAGLKALREQRDRELSESLSALPEDLRASLQFLWDMKDRSAPSAKVVPIKGRLQ